MQALATFIEGIQLWVLGLFLFGLFWLAAATGRFLSKGRSAEDDESPGLVVSASLGLLALLLGFTVSMAVSRYDLRRAATLQEANAIGTFLYRTDLMPAEQQQRTRAALDRYLEARLAVGQMGETPDGVAEAGQISARAQAVMWQEVLATGQAVPDASVRILMVQSANDMFDMATARDAALANRLPTTLSLLLFFFPVASLVLIGYVSGKSIGVHLMASTELILLLTLVLLLIADLNRPRSGSILTPQTPLLDVQAQLRAGSAAQSVAAPTPAQ